MKTIKLTPTDTFRQMEANSRLSGLTLTEDNYRRIIAKKLNMSPEEVDSIDKYRLAFLMYHHGSCSK